MPSILANPYVLLAAGGLLLASHGLVYFQGRGDGAAGVQAKYARATGKALAAMRKGEAAIDRVNGAYASARTRQDGANRSIYNAAAQILPRPIYSSTCVDPDGVGLLDRARAAGNIALDPVEPDGSAP